MNKGVKFRIYPNKEQENLILQTFGCCRLIYNKGLDMRNTAYKNGEKANFAQTCAMVTRLKRDSDFSFLKEVDAVALQQSLRDLDGAYQNFFKKRARFPRFKSKHDNYQSYRTLNAHGTSIRIVGNYLRLPKLGYVKIKQSMEVRHINNATIEKTPTGKYFAVLNVDFEPDFKQNNGNSIGIDVGLKEFYTDSNGNKVDNPRYFEKSERKLKREQRKLSRKQKKLAIKQAKKNLKVMVDNLSHEIDMRILERVTNRRG
jgi:putative transposase